ncbi:hypothetical protein HM1_1572 [Heliomicrobium modesticaldum Ice1]|uniref:Uncharacterized protein n=1 Tax=Heliobacterium modesticaldum (strain ATCC 51547 / Ice1) TaxID=498761 RepID=B0TDA1_HELMI|nr:hypothetical protein [Heliomicrobium modesticaldum]ABZ84142.1 hypothetical protein HM1_1572 [Heliomicrobium modesticaldum Ice1]
MKRNLINEVKEKFPNVNDVFFNEENNKLLILENDFKTKTSAVYLTDNKFLSTEKLPFVNAYRAYWVDKNHVLVAYKEGNKSILAKYNLADKSASLTNLPDNNTFLDPQISNDEIIRFFYKEPSAEKPWGFLDLDKKMIIRAFFKESNPVSSVQNGRMGGFTESSSQAKKQLFLYEIASNKMIVRSEDVDNPYALAVSPDGENIIFAVSTPNGETRLYSNRKP